MANGTAQSAMTLRRDTWWVAPLVTAVVLGVIRHLFHMARVL